MNEKSMFIYPTDTVWGLGGSIWDKKNFDLTLRIKGIHEPKPFSLLYPNLTEVKKNFDISWLDHSKLELFFSLESTLAIDLTFAKVQLPEWVTNKSDFICLRVLDKSEINKIFSLVAAPIFTTSLNLTGQPPVIHREEAYQFYQKHSDLCNFIEQEEIVVSGLSSSIVKIRPSGTIKFLREGRLSPQIKKINFFE